MEDVKLEARIMRAMNDLENISTIEDSGVECD